MELLKKRLANLLSVKSIVTLCLTITFCVLTVQAKVTQEFNTVYLMVIAFLFRHAERQKRAGRNVNAPQQKHQRPARGRGGELPGAAYAAEREGLSVLVTETVRDAAYQRMLAEKGYAAKGAVTPSFHAEHAGLAFDICKMRRGTSTTILRSL